IFCLGCCWALMLLLFVVGTASLWWMAALTAVMVYEKVAPRGRRATPAVGVGLLALAVLVAIHPGWLPSPLPPASGRHPAPGLTPVSCLVHGDPAAHRHAVLRTVQRDHVHAVGVGRIDDTREPEVRRQAVSEANVVPGFTGVVRAVDAPVELHVQGGRLERGA